MRRRASLIIRRHEADLPERTSSFAGAAGPMSNRTLTRALSGLVGNGAGSGDLGWAVEAPPEQEAPEAEPGAIDAGSLGLYMEMYGHPDNGEAGAGAAGVGAVAKAGVAGSVEATIQLILQPPVETQLPEEEIAANHGVENVAGWTTPAYSIDVPAVTSSEIAVDVTLGFTIELAAEYTGGRLDVLRDHEQGHVNIGSSVAQRQLVTNLEQTLESLSSIQPAVVQQKFVDAAADFQTDEGAESAAYDQEDYPRMLEAYYGVVTPLADLADTSDEIAAMADTVNQFVFAAPTSELAQVVSLADEVANARDDLSDVDLARLQYNEEFGELVTAAEVVIDEILRAYDPAEAAEPMDTEAVAAHAALGALQATFNEFNWEPPV